MTPEQRRRLAYLAPLPLRRRLRAVADRFHGGQRNVLELPERLDGPLGDRVLVFAPHPDDEVVGCGGVLARHHEAGHQSMVAFMTDGRQGHQFTELRGDALVATRKAEAQEAARRLGIGQSVFLENPDGALWTCRKARHQAAALMSEFRPDVVYLPAFTDAHTDHLHTFLAVGDAASDHDPATIYLLFETWAPLVANCAISIDIERKLQALRAHASQIGRPEAFVGAVRGLACYRAMTCLLDASGHAEAFWRTDRAGLRRLLRWLR